jgi:adenosylcobinamide kinase/adenosylcobinamide-phosphate guanylyltransferase
VATQLRAEPGAAALVDDLGGWLTNTLDRRGWDDVPITSEVDDLLDAVGAFRAPLILVSPEVGLTVVPATEAGRRFADELGALNQRLAACCERVVLVVAGQPVWIKPATAPH